LGQNLPTGMDWKKEPNKLAAPNATISCEASTNPDLAENTEAGVDIMITLFCDFLTIFCEKIGVFLKDQCYDQNFAYFSFVLSQKRQLFRRIFRRKIF
jgi:hypothetical protein